VEVGENYVADEPEVGGAFETLRKNEKHVSNICLTV
jgi:hypothetical protein